MAGGGLGPKGGPGACGEGFFPGGAAPGRGAAAPAGREKRQGEAADCGRAQEKNAVWGALTARGSAAGSAWLGSGSTVGSTHPQHRAAAQLLLGLR